MRMSYLKSILKTAVLGATVLLLCARVTIAQSAVSLIAAPANATMPDGSAVPMWGYTCGAGANNATCNAMNPSLAAAPAAGAWSPVVITVPVGTNGVGNLQITLTNNLYFQPPTPAGGSAPAANAIPTSIMIVGQVGGGLGAVSSSCPAQSGTSTIQNSGGSTCNASPDHSNLTTNTVSWPVAGSSPSFVPPTQGPRVQSFGTEVAASPITAPTSTVLTWANLKPGTYLLESGTHPSIQVPMGLYGILVVTNAPTASAGSETAAGCAYGYVAATSACAVPYDAELPLAFGEIDPVQNGLVSAAVNTAGFSETAVWSGLAAQSTAAGGNVDVAAGCGNPSSQNYLTCYPPAVNYTPLYYTINGVAFNKTNSTGSVFSVTPGKIAPASGTGGVLVRMVNAGLKMHVPSIVGSQVLGATGATNPVVTGFKVMAEDANVLPGVPKIRSEIFMAAGKVYDVLINGQQTSSNGTIGAYPNALAVFDRELSLSGNATGRDEGMLGFISINGSTIAANNPTFKSATANPDSYEGLASGCTAAPCPGVTVSDPSKGVIANDVNVYGVTLWTAPVNGTVVLNRNGTFTYTPSGTATSDTFSYCANGTVNAGVCSSGITAQVTLGASQFTNTPKVTCTASTWTAATSAYLAIKTPGVLGTCTDSNGLPVTVDTSTVTSATTGLTVYADANGGFNATVTGAGTYNFTFQAMNSQGLHSTTTQASINFPTGSGLAVNVIDGKDKTTQITDYRWIIEEDRTFYTNPACTTNPPRPAAPQRISRAWERPA